MTQNQSLDVWKCKFLLQTSRMPSARAPRYVWFIEEWLYAIYWVLSQFFENLKMSHNTNKQQLRKNVISTEIPLNFISYQVNCKKVTWQNLEKNLMTVFVPRWPLVERCALDAVWVLYQANLRLQRYGSIPVAYLLAWRRYTCECGQK